MKLLIVEDEAPKLRNVRELAEELDIFFSIEEARSVGSALKALRFKTFDMVLLDMSLPTFDIGNGESGGRPQGFGGQEVLRYMSRYRLTTPVVVVTAFEAFAEQGKAIDLKALERSLSAEHPDTFRGVILYNTMFSTWRDGLRELVRGTLEAK
ncbi:response regulator [Sphingomonas parapaucimobilis]|uniref:response regulator n=1 Tax=Sphingomonas parapaucimobilis TaxID=28213 RepID=UPI0035C7D3D9